MIWSCGDHRLDLERKGLILGILNVTPDSFSDGGRYATLDAALRQAERMIEEGAAIIDVGGESTRPGADEVAAEVETERVVPVITEIVREFPSTLISIDTSKPPVGRAAIEAGARILNDVTGFRDPEMRALAAGTGAGVISMHMKGTPRTMQENPTYRDVVAEVREFFEKCYRELVEDGVRDEAIVFDPGIGFGKTVQHNLALLGSLPELVVEDRPLLLGVSRKSFIGKVLDSDRLEDRFWPTVAITSYARERGVRLHRVHDVRPNAEALRMTEAILNTPPPSPRR